jgi:hypothetical protein
MPPQRQADLEGKVALVTGMSDPRQVEELEHLSGSVLDPTQVVGEPVDIAGAALWLADPANWYVTSVVRSH